MGRTEVGHNGFVEFEKTIQQLQDTMTVMAGIQARQAEALKGHSQWLEELQQAEERHQRWLEDMQRGQVLHEQRMAEVDEKLDAIIQIVDSLIKRDRRS